MMTKRERVLTAILHMESDKLPKGEIEIAPNLMAWLLNLPEDTYDSRVVPLEDAVHVREMLGMDLACVEMGLPAPTPTGNDSAERKLIKDVWGNTRVLDEEGVFAPYVVRPVITNTEEMAEYMFPRIDDFSDAEVRQWSKLTDFFVFALLGGAFETARLLCGLEQLSLWLYSNVEELKVFLSRIVDFQTAVARKAVTAGAHAILISDDMANNKATFLSPSMMRDIFFPALKNMVGLIKQTNVPVFLHSDGNINEVLSDIADCGFDGLHSIQPSAGMSLSRVKKDYGHRLCLMGNIDLDYVLPFGSPQDVRQAVNEAVKIGYPGGGYILSTCNMLTRDIPVENVHAMYNV